jgi:hypothetical protein
MTLRDLANHCICSLVDGWGLIEDQSEEYSCALAFAKSLDSAVHPEPDVMNAYLQGVKKATAVIKFYANKRRARRTQVT